MENPYAYLKSLKPKEFNAYSVKPTYNTPTKEEIKKLTLFLSKLPHDRNMLVYLWRFVFFIDKKIIKQYSGVEYANGISEILRFVCKRHIDYRFNISDRVMEQAFRPLLPDFEILLVSYQAGICWRTNKLIPPHIANALDSEQI